MNKPLLHLDRLSQADLGKFSVLLSQLLTNGQRAKLNVNLPDVMAQIGAFDSPMGVPQPEVLSTQAPGQTISGPEWKNLEMMAKAGQFIQCIKKIREICGIGLKEAKDYADKHLGHLRPRDSGFPPPQY